MVKRVFVFLPQADQHSFFMLWAFVLLIRLQTYDGKLILCKLPGSSVETNFSIVSQLFNIEFHNFQIDLLEDSDIICAHVHDEYFQAWFLHNKNLLLKQISILFYTDGSNPLIENRHADYFGGHNSRYGEVRYMVFPASRSFYFWWENLITAEAVSFDIVSKECVVSSYSLLNSYYLEKGIPGKDTLLLGHKEENITIVMPRPLDRKTYVNNEDACIISRYLLSNIKEGQVVLVKFDSRMHLRSCREIVNALQLNNYKVIEIGPSHASCALEFMMPSISCLGIKNIDVYAFSGSLVFNTFLFSNIFDRVSIHYEYPEEIWKSMSEYEKSRFMTKVKMARIMGRAIPNKFYWEEKTKYGSTFNFRDSRMISPL